MEWNYIGILNDGKTILQNKADSEIRIRNGADLNTTFKNKIRGGVMGINTGGAGTKNVISQNSIVTEAGLGISLQGNNMPTPNDFLDNDPGPNNLQNYPVLQTRFQQ